MGEEKHAGETPVLRLFFYRDDIIIMTLAATALYFARQQLLMPRSCSWAVMRRNQHQLWV